MCPASKTLYFYSKHSGYMFALSCSHLEIARNEFVYDYFSYTAEILGKKMRICIVCYLVYSICLNVVRAEELDYVSL